MANEARRTRDACCPKLKLFLASMAFVSFAKAFGGAYMKSCITQIERRFDISSSQSGVIDGSFEMGNLLVIAFVSYFGAKLHRPRLMGIGCLIMAAGSYITALPHFFQGPYKYETSVSHRTDFNTTETIIPCLSNHSVADPVADLQSITACEKASGSSMWIYVFMGNMLRGIGESPIMPLGISYMDDFSLQENTPLYLSAIQTVGIMGPMVGFLVGSYLSKIYVDVGFVNLDEVTITIKDSRWVGAWWLGFIITGTIVLLSSIPFWFLPKSLSRQGDQEEEKEGEQTRNEVATVAERENFLSVEAQNERQGRRESEEEEDKNVSLRELAKDFFPSLKRLFSSSVYILIILTSLVAVNGFIGMITFKPKYMEQVFGQTASKAILLIGIMNLPAVGLGVISGGIFLKKFKLGAVGAARLAICASLGSFSLLSVQAFISCENSAVAGLTVSYQGTPHVSYNNQTLLSQCNTGCSCSLKQWDPVCAYNGITYASPCLAGCQTSTGSSKNMFFHNCTCIGETMNTASNMSASLGQCQRPSDCNYMFKIYMALSVTGSFISAFGGTAGYIVLLRSIEPDLKSFALGMQTLIVRTLGGIPPPIYFGALIDQTCLKWGTKQCGGRGACRIYDSHGFRLRFMGLICSLYLLSNMMWGGLYSRIVVVQRRLALRNQAQENRVQMNGVGNGHAVVSVAEDKGNNNSESTI